MIKFKAHTYQLRAISFLLDNPNSGLFLDPGLGKTAISLATMKILRNLGEAKGVLIIAPLRVCLATWPDEIKKWSNFNTLSFNVLHGKGKNNLWDGADIQLINPEGLKWLYDELLEGLHDGNELPFNTLWIDESTRFKNHTANCFKTIKEMLPLFIRTHIMTGTPASSSLLNLWSQIFILDRGLSLEKSFYKFRNKYFISDDWNKYKFHLLPGRDKLIQDQISPLILDMEAGDHIKLPGITYNNIEVVLNKKAMSLYRKMENEFFLYLDNSSISADQAAQVSLKCHQIANGMVYEDLPLILDDDEIENLKNRKSVKVHDGKKLALNSLIDELNGQQLLIAYHYKHDLENIIDSNFKKLNYAIIGSGTTETELKEIIAKWNNNKIQILFGHPKSMAHGLNLQKTCRNICWYSLPWSLEDYIQFNARIYRQGASGSIKVHHLVSKNTLDLAILSRLGTRAKQQIDLRSAIRSYQKL